MIVADAEPALDLSVIVVARDEIPHIWYTVHAVQQQVVALDPAAGTAEIVVVDDGSTDGTREFLQNRFIRGFVRGFGTAGVFAPRARHLGALRSRGRWLLFLDAHVLLSPGFLDAVMGRFAGPAAPGAGDAGAIHFPLGWNWNGRFCDHYGLTLEKNFWGEHRSGGFTRLTEIGASGHGAVLVRRDRFFQVGGFGAPFEGYGGEETYLDLKLARFGYRNYTFPQVYYLHCSQRVSNPWKTLAMYRNDVLSAYVLGGETWAGRVRRNHWVPPGTDRAELDVLYEDALRRGEAERALLERTAPLTLDEVLEGLRERGAAGVDG